MTTTSTVDTAISAATKAARPMAGASPSERATWLRVVADALDAAADELIPIAMAETHLPEARLRGELVRTTFQARLLGDAVEQGWESDVRVDAADPEWPMGPRPDLRRTTVPLGPVVVFAASNFPFAFSVFGGDTVSALAAGCPVILKTHPGHPRLSDLTARIVVTALTDIAPTGAFATISSDEDGTTALADPRIKAGAFTGSTRVGRILFDVASRRPQPIPFFGELGSTNPVVVTQDGWRSRADEIAREFAQSVTLGSGQFCTKPGVLIVPDAGDFAARVPTASVGPMLNDRIAQGFLVAARELADLVGDPTAVPSAEPFDGPIPLFCTTAAHVLENPTILELEVFGPAALVVEYLDHEQALAVVDASPGQLTGTVIGGSEPDGQALELIPRLAERVGRVLWNQWPTGVTVASAQQHGGPYPATTAAQSTSVGTAAISRFRRPVAYQNMPAAALPPELR
ncbi:aldehyde dehydrogenase (NADP(+)) [Mycolicibacterium sp. 018/SC-01/001]|uniref:aldehyde dehydrogenase (NADP(+)) n=1 Tax=Mycolicibacterium sp. 018/SC-01/001 TaxID=2592069 RepID=UPI00117D3866|nr:aldehyde dehydrogenase (NADP(+)) [Mycolicibacterium sp. 018/SC-01/001]TRW88869.1 aldehyde dehydrogenase (NADP(+)) [Mycolicibacterium sp. 018/SC-01/001]